MGKDYQPTEDVIRHVDEMLKLLRVLSMDSRFGEIDPKELGKLKENGGVTMCEVLDKVENRGLERGIAQGMELTSWLLGQGRIDDLKQATTDKVFFDKLLAEMAG